MRVNGEKINEKGMACTISLMVPYTTDNGGTTKGMVKEFPHIQMETSMLDSGVTIKGKGEESSPLRMGEYTKDSSETALKMGKGS